MTDSFAGIKFASPVMGRAFERNAARLRVNPETKTATKNSAPHPKHGEDIFPDADAPRTWEDYRGQDRAAGILQAAIASAQRRDVPLAHVLIASGLPGVGKSTLARIIAAQMDAGIVETQGPVTGAEAHDILANMSDGDVWFIDEAHQLTQGGKGKAEWLLSFLQDGTLMTAEGAKKMPRVTVVAATTDSQLLPETILQRFPLKPIIVAYTDDHAISIAGRMASSIFTDEVNLPIPGEATLRAVCGAANNSPRVMRSVLSTLRDAALAGQAPADEDGNLDLSTTLAWTGLTLDGLDDLAQRYLMTLLVMCNGTGSRDVIAAQLGESTIPAQTEKMLMQLGYIEVGTRGRSLTEEGTVRATELCGGYLP